MKISAQEEYGLRCLVQVARQPGGASLSLRQIAEAEGISHAYAGKLLWILSHAGLVKATRGAKGGYTLARPSTEITLSEVIKVLDQDDIDAHCSHYPGDLAACIHTGDCTIKPVVEGLNNLVHTVLSNITLAQLMGGQTSGLERLTQISPARAARAPQQGAV
jgi:Rrf2 family transcriptional regulator, iron-sulfur cluster assembly transcription factor